MATGGPEPARGATSRTAALGAALLALAGCGYSVAAGAGRMPAGAERVRVEPFENRTTDAEAGALVTAALRDELARRGTLASGEAPAVLEGAVERSAAAPSSPAAATLRLTLVVAASLRAGGRVLAEARVQREEDYLGATDALETEGRRRVALRRAAREAARLIAERLETP